MDTTKKVLENDSEGNEVNTTLTPLSGTENTVHRMTLGDIDDSTREAIVSLLDSNASGEEQITEHLTVEVRDPCDNGVLLFWKNSLGGDSWWMFDESQEYEYAYPSGRKVRRMKLFADNLLIDQWDAINELNSPTDVIASTIVDYGMGDSVNKTHFRNDNQVYIVTSEGEKTGVIVLASSILTKTHQAKHAIDITIELPEIFPV